MTPEQRSEIESLIKIYKIDLPTYRSVIIGMFTYTDQEADDVIKRLKNIINPISKPGKPRWQRKYNPPNRSPDATGCMPRQKNTLLLMRRKRQSMYRSIILPEPCLILIK